MNDYNMEKLKEDYPERYLDIGTGDGRFVVKSALKFPNKLYIGIDPAKNIELFQREINRKKIKNSILIQSSIENFNFEDFQQFFNGVTIILPWGNLLKYIAECDSNFFEKIESILKPGSDCLIIFGYEEYLESSQTQRLNLPELNEDYIQTLTKMYKNLKAFKLTMFVKVNNTKINKVDSSWAKKLSIGKNKPNARPYYEIILKKIIDK